MVLIVSFRTAGKVQVPDNSLERLESLLAFAVVDGSDLVVAADLTAQPRDALLSLRNVKEVSDSFEYLDRADSRLKKMQLHCCAKRLMLAAVKLRVMLAFYLTMLTAKTPFLYNMSLYSVHRLVNVKIILQVQCLPQWTVSSRDGVPVPL